jgi:hypothetical protein
MARDTIPDLHDQLQIIDSNGKPTKEFLQWVKLLVRAANDDDDRLDALE